MKGYKQMSESERMKAFFMLKGMMKDGKIPHGGFSKVAKVFQVTRFTISRLWDRAGAARVDPLIKSPQQIKLSKRSGRPPKYTRAGVRDAVRGVPLAQRKCFRDLEANTHIPKSSLFNMISARGKGKDNGFRRHSSAPKPHLSDQNMFERCMFALSKRNGNTYKE